MRFLFLSLALTIAPAALACGGSSCGAACPMAAATTVNDDTEAVAATDGTKLTLAVSGVHCPISAGQVRAALLNVEGIKAVAVDTAGKTEVAFDGDKLDQDAIVAAIDAVDGFEATVPATNTDG